MASRIILSPHQDDAVFSLWHVLSGPGEVMILNVFAGVPATGELGWWDALTGATDPRSRARERRDEDLAALARAGRTATDLEFLDLQYRTDEQPLEPLVAAIESAAPNGSALFAPAGLGGHLDHALVRDAALALSDRGWPVALYADVPHATRNGWPAWVTNGTAPDARRPADGWTEDMAGSRVDLALLSPLVHALDTAEAAGKIAALAEYRTQLPALTAEYQLDEHPEALRYEIVWDLARP